MAENQLKTRLYRLLRYPLASCISKDHVVEYSHTPLLTMGGEAIVTSSPFIIRCPPTSPVVGSPASLQIPKQEIRREYHRPTCMCKGNAAIAEGERASLLMKAGDNLAVVKYSSDPYGDFRTSVVEMIVQRQTFAAKDLENLLRCFLRLNAQHHHQVIVQVFAEIREALLLRSSLDRNSHCK